VRALSRRALSRRADPVVHRDIECRYRWREYLSPEVDRERPWSADEVRRCAEPGATGLYVDVAMPQEATMVGCVQNNNRPLKEIFDEYFPRRPHSFLRAQ
jgi:hypothetical protein